MRIRVKVGVNFYRGSELMVSGNVSINFHHLTLLPGFLFLETDLTSNNPVKEENNKGQSYLGLLLPPRASFCQIVSQVRFLKCLRYLYMYYACLYMYYAYKFNNLIGLHQNIYL